MTRNDTTERLNVINDMTKNDLINPRYLDWAADLAISIDAKKIV